MPATKTISLTDEELAAAAFALKLLAGRLSPDNPALQHALSAFAKLPGNLPDCFDDDEFFQDWDDNFENMPSDQGMLALSPLLQALQSNRKAKITYTDHQGNGSARTVLPIEIDMFDYWGAKLIAWCELRDNFRQFNLDQIESASVLDKTYKLRPDQSYEAFMTHMREQKKLKKKAG